MVRRRGGAPVGSNPGGQSAALVVHAEGRVLAGEAELVGVDPVLPAGRAGQKLVGELRVFLGEEGEER